MRNIAKVTGYTVVPRGSETGSLYANNHMRVSSVAAVVDFSRYT